MDILNLNQFANQNICKGLFILHIHTPFLVYIIYIQNIQGKLYGH